MRVWLVVIAAGCVHFDPPESLAPGRAEELACTELFGVSDRLDLSCVATNREQFAREVCARPFVGVRETGALYTTHEPVCSSAVLAPGQTERFGVALDMPRKLCRVDAGGCAIRAFSLGGSDQIDASAAVTFARTLAASAHGPALDRPTIAECDALVVSWSDKAEFQRYWPYVRRDPDDVRLFCLGVSRVTYACLASAPDALRADRCR
jgi:hypothetical protein